MSEYILWLDELGMGDLEKVGGKNASLGEMITHLKDLGVNVPGGFATTAEAFRDFLDQSGLADRIDSVLDKLNVDDTRALVKAGGEIRQWIMDTPLPGELEQAVRAAYAKMQARHGDDLAVAVRSSATAEDLPDASFAGQQETFLNVCGIDAVLEKIHAVFAREMPELDDEFAKDVSEFDTLDELKEDLKKKIQDREDHKIEHEVEDSVLAKAVENASMEIPE
ncbi:MAG TPA: PEP/pyruvate-binding domain-containing protein, partial [Wenzhouxiangella sp.]|nr:PEP/pyruvate-binding domain-containing protein [Wenzhouxiangella sp.]